MRAQAERFHAEPAPDDVVTDAAGTVHPARTRCPAVYATTAAYVAVLKM